MTGRFVTLEGGEGVGKSTQLQALAEALRGRGLAVVTTREPGGSVGAEAIRALLMTGSEDRWSARAEALLFAAARADHVEKLIRPALARGDWVLCDRYTDSTYAYQAVAGGIGAETVAALVALIAAPTPDLTLVLDLDPALGLGRAGSTAAGEARFEARDPDFHARVRAAFLEIAAGAPRRCVVLDATAARSDVLARARAVVAQRLSIAL